MKIGCACYLMAALLSAIPGRAAVIFSVDSVSAAIGSTGNGLDVMLRNTGPSALTVGGFSFVISTTNPDIAFTSTNISTTQPYVFAGDSFFGPMISSFAPGQSMDALDASFSGLGDVVAAGATVGLGHVLFDVSPTAAVGSFAVTLSTDLAQTSLSDSSGNNIPIDTFTNGSITIATPEPGTIVFLGSGLAAVILAKRRGRRRTC